VTGIRGKIVSRGKGSFSQQSSKQGGFGERQMGGEELNPKKMILTPLMRRG